MDAWRRHRRARLVRRSPSALLLRPSPRRRAKRMHGSRLKHHPHSKVYLHADRIAQHTTHATPSVGDLFAGVQPESDRPQATAFDKPSNIMRIALTLHPLRDGWQRGVLLLLGALLLTAALVPTQALLGRRLGLIRDDDSEPDLPTGCEELWFEQVSTGAHRAACTAAVAAPATICQGSAARDQHLIAC